MATAKRYPQLILLGDSILQNTLLVRDGFSFQAGLAEHCLRRLDIINRGFSGYSTANISVILPDIIPSPSAAKVDYLIILLGSNDACLPDSPSGQHVSLEKYRENLTAILTHSSVTAHSPKILLVTPPPVHEVHLQEGDLARGYTALTRHQAVTAKYADVVRDIAIQFKDNNVDLVDLWTALTQEAARLTSGYVDDGTLIGTLETGDNPGLRALLVDGLHLTGAGYSVFLNEVVPFIGPEWAQEPETNPKWIFPHWTIASRNDKP